jgi:hypothetical protein
MRPRIAAVRRGEAEAAMFDELRLTGFEQQHPAVFAKRLDAAIGDERRVCHSSVLRTSGGFVTAPKALRLLLFPRKRSAGQRRSRWSN